MFNTIERLRCYRVRDSTRQNYYLIWKSFNTFLLRLDEMPSSWEEKLTLFVGYLVDQKKQSSTVKSYISAIKAVLLEEGVKLSEDHYLWNSLTRACRYMNDKVKLRFPIHKKLLNVLLSQLEQLFAFQPYLLKLYKAMFSAAYYGMFRIGEITKGSQPILARDVHVGQNKTKLLFVLRSLKTHGKHVKPQFVKIPSSVLGEKSLPQNMSFYPFTEFFTDSRWIFGYGRTFLCLQR